MDLFTINLFPTVAQSRMHTKDSERTATIEGRFQFPYRWALWKEKDTSNFISKPHTVPKTPVSKASGATGQQSVSAVQESLAPVASKFIAATVHKSHDTNFFATTVHECLASLDFESPVTETHESPVTVAPESLANAPHKSLALTSGSSLASTSEVFAASGSEEYVANASHASIPYLSQKNIPITTNEPGSSADWKLSHLAQSSNNSFVSTSNISTFICGNP